MAAETMLTNADTKIQNHNKMQEIKLKNQSNEMVK